MSQYRTGTVSVTNGSQTVTGDISFWLSNVESGNLFLIVGEDATYEIGAVISDVELTLTTPYAGESASGMAYVIASSFTPLYNIPFLEKGDIETATILKRAILRIEEKLAELEAQIS